MKYVTFETDLFLTDIPDDQLDSWLPGGDCAGWFYSRLLPVSEIRQNIDPTMEDWGWIMAVTVRGVVVDISIWENHETKNRWILGISAKKKWLARTTSQEMSEAEELVATAISGILAADPRFAAITWSTEHPAYAT